MSDKVLSKWLIELQYAYDNYRTVHLTDTDCKELLSLLEKVKKEKLM